MELHHHHHHDDGHSHGSVNAELLENQEATRVLLISLLGLTVTAIIQAIIVAYSGSIALLADTIHNFGDALTSIPLWFAFMLSRRLPTKRFSYGLNRTEDMAGLMIVLVIFLSACVAGYESFQRIFHWSVPTHLGAISLAAFIGFLGNEFVAIYRIRMGKKMGSGALIADGQHARVDGITSLAVLLGVVGTLLGYPIVDPIVGLIITIMILFIVKDSAKTVFTRLLDGIDPHVIDDITRSAQKVGGVIQVTDVKARWLGHGIRTDVNITVDSNLSVKAGHAIAKDVIHQLLHDVAHLSGAQIHVDPVDESGALFHTHEALHHDDLHAHQSQEGVVHNA